MRNSRPGISLTEVLIAIFITGVGLLSLLTLFPAGMQSMAQAVQDTRVAHAKENAAALAHILGVHEESNWNSPGYTSPGSVPIPPGDTDPSYPVLIDPFGVAALQGTPAGNWVAGDTGGIPRRTLKTMTNTALISESTTFLDGIDFDRGGIPAQGSQVDRSNRYTWAWLVQRSSAHDSSSVDLHVVVFKGRSLQLGNQGVQTAEETTFAAEFSGQEPVIKITWPTNQPKPEIKQGTWVLDSTMSPRRYGQFYRVIAVTEGVNEMLLEVQNPIFQYSGTNEANGHRGKIVVMKNVVDVFDKGQLSESTP